MVIVYDTSVIKRGFDDLEAVFCSSGGHAHDCKAAEDEARLGDAFKDQEYLHFPVATLLEQFVLFVEEVVAAGGEQFAILVAVVVAVVVNDAAPWVYAIWPVGFLSVIGQDAIGCVAIISETADVLPEQAQLSQRMPPELRIRFIAVKGSDS